MLLLVKATGHKHWENFFSNLQNGWFMRRLAAFFMIIFFVSILTGPSTFMLSIERGKVYTESFNLNHILKAAYSSQTKNSQDMQSSLESCLIFCHRHIQLTRCTIPEKRVVLAGADIHADVDLLRTNHTILNSLTTRFSPKHPEFGSHIKLPISSLLQSSVLLIWYISNFVQCCAGQ